MPGSLFSYNQQVRRFCADKKIELLNELDITEYVNRARREIALVSHSIRRLTPISGAITSATILTTGSGYTNPTLVITPPDFPSGYGPTPGGAQARGVAHQLGGQILDVEIEYGGSGYFQPEITITDPTGVGATVRPNLTSDEPATAEPGSLSVLRHRPVAVPRCRGDLHGAVGLDHLLKLSL